MLMGEDSAQCNLDHFLAAIETAYATKTDKGEIRRINVEIAPLSVDDFKRLKAAEIGTYVVFQETYHRPTYKQVHPSGRKADYDWRVTAMDRAMQAGIDDVGIGVLFGLYDYRFEVLALLDARAVSGQDPRGRSAHDLSAEDIPGQERAAVVRPAASCDATSSSNG